MGRQIADMCTIVLSRDKFSGRAEIEARIASDQSKSVKVSQGQSSILSNVRNRHHTSQGQTPHPGIYAIVTINSAEVYDAYDLERPCVQPVYGPVYSPVYGPVYSSVCNLMYDPVYSCVRPCIQPCVRPCVWCMGPDILLLASRRQNIMGICIHSITSPLSYDS